MSAQPLLVIGNRNYSSWSLRPWILAQHLGIALDTERLALDTPEFRSQALAYTPLGRVPVLVHGNIVIPESIAILEYLSELAGGRGWPVDTAKRAHARALAAEMHAGFTSLRAKYPMNIRARDRRVPMDDALARDIARIDAIFAQSETGAWLCGDYCAADAMYLPVAFRFRTYGYDGLSTRACDYIEYATRDPLVADWVRLAEAETEILEQEEAGR
jgi:glutathione S-transferase